MKEALTDPNWSLALQPVQVEVSRGGDLGYTRGTYVLTATDPASRKTATEKGRFVTIFRREADGQWKALQHISNAEAPAAASS
jgi:ketosteroid isomerase-like protein